MLPQRHFVQQDRQGCFSVQRHHRPLFAILYHAEQFQTCFDVRHRAVRDSAAVQPLNPERGKFEVLRLRKELLCQSQGADHSFGRSKVRLEKRPIIVSFVGDEHDVIVKRVADTRYVLRECWGSSYVTVKQAVNACRTGCPSK